MGYVIWGTGNRGANLYRYFQNNVKAFIDSNPSKSGTSFFGKPVIGFDEYRSGYAEDILIVSPYKDDAIVDILSSNGIFEYFRSNDCPWEVVEAYEPEILENIEKYVQMYEYKKTVLVGFSVYGILVFRVLRSLGINCVWVSERNFSNAFCRKIEKQEGAQIISIDDLSNINVIGDIKNVAVLVVSGERNQHISERVLSDEWKELFFLGEFLPKRFVNNDICQFKDKHKGQCCFIVATGPSVRTEDLDLLHQSRKLCISMNKIFYAFDQTDWRPDYYVGEDFRLFQHYSAEIREKVHCVKFLADTYDWEHELQGEHSFKYHVSFSDRHRRICGDENFSQGYMCGYSVVIGCLYLAMYMGFSQIYLVGVDLSYSKDFSDGGNHFYMDKDTVGKSNSDAYSPFYANTVIKNCEYIFRLAQKRGIGICNATRGGMLEVFPRVDFDNLF